MGGGLRHFLVGLIIVIRLLTSLSWTLLFLPAE